MSIILIGFMAGIATLLGGLFALRIKDKLHLVLGFSAGAVLGVAFFDLLPEAFALTAGRNGYIRSLQDLVPVIIAGGFFGYMLLDRLFIGHCHEDDAECRNQHHRGKLAAGSLIFHSFLDGLIIGLAWQDSPTVGAIVTAAVLTHDFSDGLNTVNLILKSGQKAKMAFKWLIADALAPILGVISTLFFSVKNAELGIIMAVFCGFFLYIGASELLPESHHSHGTRWTTIMTLLGAGVLYAVIKVLG